MESKQAIKLGTQLSSWSNEVSSWASTKYLMTFIDDLLMKIQVYNVLSQEQIKYATNIQRIQGNGRKTKQK